MLIFWPSLPGGGGRRQAHPLAVNASEERGGRPRGALAGRGLYGVHALVQREVHAGLRLRLLPACVVVRHGVERQRGVASVIFSRF